MKIIVIGCGSIGQRHIRNLVSLKAGKIFAYDINKKKLKGTKHISPQIVVSNEWDKLWEESPEVAFICVPTALHIEYAIKAAEKNCHLFIEKPLSDTFKNINKLMNLIELKKLITMIGCNVRFYWAIKKIKSLLEKNMIGKVISARIETGQYLPDWHPWEDYRNMYSAKKKLGGGVILDAIHEIDYAMWFFGDVEDVRSMYGKLSNLEIETEDVAEIILKFKNGPIVNIHMDYVQRTYSRSCKVIGEKGTIFWDFNEHTVKLFLANSKKWKVFCEPSKYNVNQMYIDEIKYFLNCIKKKQNTLNSVCDALETLKVALTVKKEGIYV